MCVMALGLIGGLVSAMGSMAAASGQADRENMQAAAYERQARIERHAGEYEADRQRTKSAKLISRQRTGYLSAGVSLDGTALDVIEDTTRETELDIAAIKYGHEVKAQNFETQAQIHRVNAKNTKTAGMIGALSPLLKGFSGEMSFGGQTNFGGSDYSNEDA